MQTTTFRLVFNGWDTNRRHQRRGTSCMLGCRGHHSEDAIEHYVGCPTLRRFAHERLRIPVNVLEDRRYLLFLCSMGAGLRVRLALLWHAAYKLRNDVAHRNPPSPSSPSVSLSYLWSEVQIAAELHSRSIKFVRDLDP